MRNRIAIEGRTFRFAALGAVVGLIVGATVALSGPLHTHSGISFVPAPPAEQSPPLSTLSNGPPIALERAFGRDDEDCVYQIKTIVRPGSEKLHPKKLICRE